MCRCPGQGRHAFVTLPARPSDVLVGPTLAEQATGRGPSFASDGIVRPGEDQDWQVDRNSRFRPGKLLRSYGFLDTLRHGPFLRWPPAGCLRTQHGLGADPV